MASGAITRSSTVGAEDVGKSLAAPKGVLILPKAIVPKETDLKGEITVGQGTILHPSCRIIAENGPIVIGEGNIIEEKVIIRNRFPVGKDGTRRILFIGSRNLFEAYAVVEGVIGNNNSILCKARVGPLTTISTGCVIGVMCCVNSDETLPPDTIIIGEKMARRTAETPQSPPFIEDHVEYLQKQLPTYHYILKSSV